MSFNDYSGAIDFGTVVVMTSLRATVIIVSVLAVPAWLLLAFPSATAAVSGQIALPANSLIGQGTINLFSLQANTLHGVTCKIWITGPDDLQHVWWRIRVDTSGVSPGYTISTQELFRWVHFDPVWLSVVAPVGSQSGTAYLQIVNSDPVSQTFNYWCERQALVAGTSASVISSSSCVNLPSNVHRILVFTSPSLAASTLYRAQFGVTVDPSSTIEDIETVVEGELKSSSGVPEAVVTRNNVFWETEPTVGRLPLDISVFGLTSSSGSRFQLYLSNFDSVTRSFCWIADIISSGTAIRETMTDSGWTSVVVSAQTRKSVLNGWPMDSRYIYIVVFALYRSGNDVTQFVNWGCVTRGSDGIDQEGAVQSVYQWWSIPGTTNSYYNWESHTWRNDVSPPRQYAWAFIGNWDTQSQTFGYRVIVYRFAA